MKIQKTIKSATSVDLNIVAEADEIAPIKLRVLKKLAASVKVAGFRSGKAPLAVIEKNLDQNVLIDEFMNEALNEFYGSALEEEKLRPCGPPKVTLKKFVPFTTIEFNAEVEVIGEIKVADYKRLKVKKSTVSVSENDVEEVVQSLRTRMAKKIDASRPSKNGDELIIDFKGRDSKGNPVSGADGKDYPLILGSNTFIPGFEANLIGVRSGQEKKFIVTFPSDYGVKSLQSKKVTFEVKVNKVNELEKPEVNDAFAADAGPFTKLSQLRSDIKKQLYIEREVQAKREFENELIRAITEKSSVEIPYSVIDDQVMRFEEEEKKNLVYRGQTWQEHLAAESQTEQQHRASKRPEAEQRVKAGLILSEISEKEHIQVSKEDLDTRLHDLKAQYKDPAMASELDKPENRHDIATRILTEKTVAKLVDYQNS